MLAGLGYANYSPEGDTYTGSPFGLLNRDAISPYGVLDPEGLSPALKTYAAAQVAEPTVVEPAAPIPNFDPANPAFGIGQFTPQLDGPITAYPGPSFTQTPTQPDPAAAAAQVAAAAQAEQTAARLGIDPTRPSPQPSAPLATVPAGAAVPTFAQPKATPYSTTSMEAAPTPVPAPAAITAPSGQVAPDPQSSTQAPTPPASPAADMPGDGSGGRAITADPTPADPHAHSQYGDVEEGPAPPGMAPLGTVGTGPQPIELDLDGNGVSVTPLTSSNLFETIDSDGYKHRTAWAGSGDAVLFYDPNGLDAIANADQYIFTDWDPSATTDMGALKDVFDTNHDGQLDAGDTGFADFKLMVTNADGTQSVETLAQAGVSSIDLTLNSVTRTFSDGSMLDGETTFTRADGSTGTVASVTYAAAWRAAEGQGSRSVRCRSRSRVWRRKRALRCGSKRTAGLNNEQILRTN